MKEIGFAIWDALRSLMLSLCEIVYKLIIFFFDAFETIGTASIINNGYIEDVYSRIGLLLGLFMTFRLVFSAIQYIMQPNLLSDNKKGFASIIKKVIIVIVLLGTTPSIFKFAFKIQDFIVKDNSIATIITGKRASISEDYGANLAATTFMSFYSLNTDYYNEDEHCPYFKSLASNGRTLIANELFSDTPSLSYAKECLNDRHDQDVTDLEGNVHKQSVYVVNFDGNGVIPLIVGCVILWMVIVYTLQVGIRVFQLAYLQLIAPIPIMLYLDPKNEESLNKWFKQCITTYLDFFIRTAIIYLVIVLIDFVSASDFLVSIDNSGGITGVYIKIVLILALLVFANKIPKLLKEVFPSLGSSGAASFDFGLNPKKVLNDTWAARAIGGTIGAVGAGASNAVHGYMNMRKAFKDNGGWKSGKAWGAAVGAGLKGTASVAGGILGGARAGLKTKDISKAGEAIKTANKNRTDRELRTEAGYHWYNPLPAMGDKILEFAGEPGAADNIKNRQQAIRDEKKRQSDYDRGERIYNTYSKIKPNGSKSLDEDKAFRNDKYRQSYVALGQAKEEAKRADIALSAAQAKLNAAHISGDDIRIAEAKENYEKAYGNSKSMQGKLELAKAKHDSNKKIYVDDAEIEKLYKYYSDTHTEDKNNATNDDASGNSTSIDNSNVDSSVFEAVQTNYREKDDEVSTAGAEVADAIAKEPFSDNVKSARENFVRADQARDEAAEKMKEVDSSNNTASNLNNSSTENQINVTNMSKSQLMIKKVELQNRREILKRKYIKLEEKQLLSDESIDTAELGRLANDINNLTIQIDKIDSILNNL